MRRSIRELRNMHQGQDVWIIASGASAGYVDVDFFRNKITMGVNRVWQRYRFLDYVVVKEQAVLQAAIESGSTVISSKHNCGTLAYAENEAKGDFYYFEHRGNELTKVALDLAEDEIVVSYSTITSAMHLAAYMGAENILLVGHDCGRIDGQQHYEGYLGPIDADEVWYDGFLRDIEPQSLLVRDWLQKRYGCRIYSLNPWLNVGLEGHKWER